MQVNLRGYYILFFRKNPSGIIYLIYKIKSKIIPYLNMFLRIFGIIIGKTRACMTCHAKIFIRIWLIYHAIGKISHTEKRMWPIIHEENIHLGKSCVTLTDLGVKVYEQLSRVMLYVKNTPSQTEYPVKQNFNQNSYY